MSLRTNLLIPMRSFEGLLSKQASRLESFPFALLVRTREWPVVGRKDIFVCDPDRTQSWQFFVPHCTNQGKTSLPAARVVSQSLYSQCCSNVRDFVYSVLYTVDERKGGVGYSIHI
jgi:hypothetical protein